MKKLKGYMHGVNLGGWLSQCDHTKERYDFFITESDIEVIKSWGMDHIRVPVDYDLVEDAQGNYKEDGFAYIQKAIEWCKKNKLNMVLDLHKTFGYSFDSGEGELGFFEKKEYQDRFYKLWEQFAIRFGKNDNMLAFELLNEVTKKEYCEIWNDVSRECITRIRKISPNIKILVGGYYNNSIEALKDLAEPYDDNIVYNFHCYEPLIFTHQGAPWIKEMDTEFRMPFDSTYGQYIEFNNKHLDHITGDMSAFDRDAMFGPEFFDRYLAEAVKVAEERNVMLYCGEYGVIDRATPEDALKWYKVICKTFDKYGIGRAAWSYKEMDFGLSDERMKGVIGEITKIM
ncbi:glycosyl hydrolase family 5 [Butyrivibrio sp. XB500-5]|uniref:glycoside hydrolase family 5 protein n=1 Tax=Butyrivibrio sp. XB500-5 TaxID=2364880 RepID=UPI000EA8905D|nr:cellulase family glycosylhydrolase [Butyrivibrio sp. XB500-5]RKM63290.1 glycosyl hydrolase family 5 [Butyrivibrio sp. XB500-5]